jgi:hypothetical protein
MTLFLILVSVEMVDLSLVPVYRKSTNASEGEEVTLFQLLLL